jgi:hypothetical protein
MAVSQAELVERFQLELGDALEPLIDPGSLYRWINDGKDRLGARFPKTATVTWSASAVEVDLPADFQRLDRLVPSQVTSMPAYRIFGRKLRFHDAAGSSSGGSATIDYWALYPAVTSESGFAGEDAEAYALVSYMLHRFFVWLASSRTDYRRYSTLTGQNGIRFDDLYDVANSHLVDFRESASVEFLADALTYYGE